MLYKLVVLCSIYNIIHGCSDQDELGIKGSQIAEHFLNGDISEKSISSVPSSSQPRFSSKSEEIFSWRLRVPYGDKLKLTWHLQASERCSLKVFIQIVDSLIECFFFYYIMYLLQ